MKLLFTLPWLVLVGCGIQQVYQGEARLTLNTEPQGARVYELPGKYVGTTPLEVSYPISAGLRSQGILETCEFVFVKDGCLPAKRQFRLQIAKGPYITRKDIFNNTSYSWRPYHELTILSQDPDAPFGSTRPAEQHIRISQEESDLDKALKTGQLILLIKTLSLLF